ncbi:MULTISPECIES: hypothetical protein [unclassified Neptuniibacter]|uniref:hypothetical protein n=1 Tax=unclassified Neptuniibacter TaxID=2630693 RepID=UPI0025DD04ED|nr:MULTISPECIES: hypothetical protein [unclassified Neptuniibacter]|tara:strand:- start:13836 stop:14141 length:306 start_codon:yes stop_codon:yes gene_type:complete
MTESIASWMTLTALFASAGWYIFRSTERSIPLIVTSIMSGILCLFGGFLFSGAVLKILGSFENPIMPALFVWLGTALCIFLHTIYSNRKNSTTKTNERTYE